MRAVTPVMTSRNWKVAHLTEFLPRSERLLGVNVNRGVIIKIRLRSSRSATCLFRFEAVVETLLHELVHCVFGPHDRTFYALLDKIKEECELSLTSVFLGASIPLVFPVPSPPPAGAKRKVRKPQGGVKLGGAKARKGKSQRELCLQAAERRAQDAFACALENEEDQLPSPEYKRLSNKERQVLNLLSLATTAPPPPPPRPPQFPTQTPPAPTGVRIRDTDVEVVSVVVLIE